MKIAILYFEVYAIVYRADTDFLDGLAFKPFRKWNFYLFTAMQLGELPTHRHRQESIIDIYGISGQNKVEHTAFFSIAGHFDILEAIFT